MGSSGRSRAARASAEKRARSGYRGRRRRKPKPGRWKTRLKENRIARFLNHVTTGLHFKSKDLGLFHSLGDPDASYAAESCRK